MAVDFGKFDVGSNNDWDGSPAPKFQDPRRLDLPSAAPAAPAPAAVPKTLAGSPVNPSVPGITPKLPTGAPPAMTPDQMVANPSAFGGAGVKDIGALQSAQLQLGTSAASEEAKAKVDQAQQLANAEKQRTDLTKEYADTQKQLIEQHKQDLKEASAFAPTPERAKDIAGIFSLLTLATFGSGGRGKYSGMAALQAMTGAMKGYQQGRKDVFERDLKTYEENLKALESHNKKVETLYNDAMKLMATDKELGMQKIQQLIAEDNTGIVSRLARSGQYKQLGEAIGTITKSLETLREKQMTLANEKAKIDYEYQKKAEFEKVKVGNKSAADRYGFGDIVAGASNEAAAALKNIMGLPFDSSAGIFGGKTTNSLFTAPLDAMANKLTTESVQRYNVESGKLGFSLAQLMSGGRVVRQGDIDAMNKIITAKEGDTMNTVATKIAEARQLAERTMEVRMKSPNTPPGLKEVFAENLQTVQSVVPFTVDDINATVKEKGKKKTFGEALGGKYVDTTAPEEKYSDAEKEARYQQYLKDHPND